MRAHKEGLQRSSLAPRDIVSTNNALMLAIRSLRPVDTLEYNPDSWNGFRGIFRKHLVSVPSYTVVEGNNPVQTERNIQGKSIGRLGLLYVLEVQMIQPRKSGDFEEYVGPIIAAALYPGHADERIDGMVRTDHFVAMSVPFGHQERTRFTKAS